MVCTFCGSNEKVVPCKQWEACHACRGVSKKCKKGSGVYYNVVSHEYQSEVPMVSGNAAVFDLHNVVDRYEPKEFVDRIASKYLVANYTVYVLSYVGSTTNTRLEAQEYMEEIQQHCEHINCYLCFHRDDKATPGSKGGFITQLNAESVVFFDDGDDHVRSAEAAGAKAILIDKDSERARQQLIAALP